MPRVELICTGSELLTGKINTHVAYIGRQLAKIGLEIAREHTVGDDAALMTETCAEAYRRSEVVLCAGGLGPTFDDLTRDVWSKILKRPLLKNTALVADVTEKFVRRGIPMPPQNLRQAKILKGADVINNDFGTAPGQYFDSGKKIVVLLPGPARELYPMMESFVMPRLRQRFLDAHLQQKILLVFGVPESRIDERVRRWVARRQRLHGCAIIHGILASQAIISVKFTARGNNPVNVQRAIDQLTKEARGLLGPLVFGEGNDTLEGVVGQLLKQKSKTIAVAESCTGGLIAKLLTDFPGASDYFREGMVTYANASKKRRLGVRERTLATHGAVSEQTAREMATGLRKTTGADYTLAVTGIAGPTGGTPEKPVGLVYIGLAGPRRVRVYKFTFGGERSHVRHRAALTSLDLLRKELVRA